MGGEPDPPPAPGTDIRASLLHAGTERTYQLFVPDGLEGPAPLLLLLHGGLGDADTMRQKTDMDRWASAWGFIAAYPNGTGESPRPDQRTWNAVHCCGRAHDLGADDVGFLAALVAEISASYPVDTTRIGVAGHSNGAMMAYRAAAERSDLFTHVASVAGTIGGQSTLLAPTQRIPEPDQPVSVLIIHARDDPGVPYDGGRGTGGLMPLRVDMSVEQSLSFWLDVTEADPGPVTEDGVVETREYINGEDGTTATLVSTEGGHGWPGAEPLSFLHELAVDTPSTPEASALVASFLIGDS